MNIYDISREAGVSIATVSRVLNGSTSVKPKTRKKVLDVIDKYGYTPNAFARGLGLNSMNSIGMVCADCSDIYLAKAVYYIEGNLRNGGFNTILTCSGYLAEGKKAAVNLLLSKRVDAIILVGSTFLAPDSEGNDYIREAAEQVPVFMLNADMDHPNVYCTRCDDLKATQDATLSLINAGINDILFLYNSKSYSGRNKLTGYQSAFIVKDIDIDRELILYYDSCSQEDIDGALEFLSETCRSKELHFHAVVAADDALATAAVKYAKLNNLSVPEELQVIGYNNSILATCCYPELTSIDNQLESLCDELVKTCIGVLNGEERPRKTIFSAELVQRGTTRL